MTSYDTAQDLGEGTDLAALDGVIARTTVQGVTVLYAPRPGDISAGLVFRVGHADETLATHGITHLVEHLALHRLSGSDAHHNGATANLYTHFHVTGGEDEVVAHLNGVCAALRDLPLDRLETEKEILRTEAAGRSGGVNRQLPLWRYGAQGHGLAAYDELGTWSLTGDQVREWAATRFTRDNAVLWITGDRLPEGLDLSLPAGSRRTAPAPSRILPVTPAYIHGPAGHVVLDAVLRRSTAASVFATVLGRALFRELRQEGGYSYSAEADYTPRDAEFATLTAYADALPEKQDAVLGAFVDTLARLRAGRIEQAELESARGRLLKQYDVPNLGAAMLPSYALSLLLGHRVLSPDEHRAELRAVTVADLREAARETWDGALLQVPAGGADWAGFVLAPQHSPSALTGSVHPSLDEHGVSLVIGDDGVSVLLQGGPVTVRYADCVAMTARPDGARVLTGLDGFRVTVEPTMYAGVSAERIAALDAAVPAGVVVPLPARDPQQIPRPSGRTSPPPATSGASGAGTKAKRPRLPLLWFPLLVLAEAAFIGFLLNDVIHTSDQTAKWSHLIRLTVVGLAAFAWTHKAYRRARTPR